LGYQLLAVWVGFFVAMLGTCYLHTEILSGIMWTTGGILLNLDLIAKNNKSEMTSLKRLIE